MQNINIDDLLCLKDTNPESDPENDVDLSIVFRTFLIDGKFLTYKDYLDDIKAKKYKELKEIKRIKESYIKLQKKFSGMPNYKNKLNALKKKVSPPKEYIQIYDMHTYNEKCLTRSAIDAKAIGMTQKQFEKFSEKNEQIMKIKIKKKITIDDSTSKFITDNLNLSDELVHNLSEAEQRRIYATLHR